MNRQHEHDVTAGSTLTLELLPYFYALRQARWCLLACTIAAVTLAAYWAFSTPYLYQAGAKVSVVDIEDPGGVSPDDRRASEVLTLVEHGFVMGTTRDNYNEVMRARLLSRDFTMHFIDRFNVYRHFYPEHWMQAENRWRQGFTPDRGESLARFSEEVRRVSHDEETDITTVAMRWHAPQVAKQWANDYVASFNEYIRQRTLEDVARKHAFLDQELRRSEVVEIRQSLYRLIEAQTAIAMLANARVEYALEIIDPAATPYRSINLSRKKKILLGTIAGLLLATFCVLGWTLLQRMLAALAVHRADYERANPLTRSSQAWRKSP